MCSKHRRLLGLVFKTNARVYLITFQEREFSFLPITCAAQLCWLVLVWSNLSQVIMFWDFDCRRMKAVFTVALTVHKEVQRRDISMGRNIGNRILQFLDGMRPQANISGSVPQIEHTSNTKNQAQLLQQKKPQKRSSTKKCSSDKMDNTTTMQASTSSNKNGVERPPYTVNFIKSQIQNSGLSRLTMRARSTTTLRVIAVGLWWQPVRKNMQSVLVSPSPQTAKFMQFSKFSRVGPLGPSGKCGGFGFAKSVLWDDIALWMRRL